MVLQCFIIFACLAIGELIVYLTGIKIPSSIIGMLILTLSLKLKIVKLEWVKGISDFLISNLGFFFVPPGVALMLYLDIIKAEWLPICLATFISIFVVIFFTGWTYHLSRKGQKTLVARTAKLVRRRRNRV